MIVAGLGFKDAIIRGMTNRKFLAYFPGVSSLDEVDLDFLEIGFIEVRRALAEDLIPSRQAWIELRGLPIQGWTEKNYRTLIKPWGDIIHFGRTIDEDGFYVVPKVLIETMQKENIVASAQVSLLGKVWQVSLVESWGTGVQLQEVSENIPGYLSDGGVVEANATDREESSERQEDASVAMDEEDVDGSCINPVTPRTTQGEFDELPDKDGAEMPELELHTSNWIPRENESSISLQRSSSGMNISEVNDELETTISDEGTNCSDMLLELKNLKVQGKRGRPRKHNKVPMNKYFKLPRKKKVRGEGLKQTSHFFLNANFDEAEAIFETGLMMGLLPLNSKDRSMELIKENLK
ncbi:hypothetical protein ACET3Z_031049 [Daucus carota]